jgi:hypothetical protein
MMIAFTLPSAVRASFHRRFLLPAVAAMALGVAWTSQAEATCGDYLMVGHSPHLVVDSSGHSLPGRDSTPIHGKLPSPCPCEGPECSSGNGPSAAVPASVRISRDPTWVTLEGKGGESLYPPTPLVPREDSLSLQRFSFRLLRPPR